MVDVSTQPGEIQLEPKVAGRPMKPIDEDLLRQFLSVKMPVEKICRYFNVSVKTMWNRYGDLIHEHYILFEYDLRSKQKELADNGDTKMLQFLGKVEMQQTEVAPLSEVPDDDEVVSFVVERPKPASGISTSESEELE